MPDMMPTSLAAAVEPRTGQIIRNRVTKLEVTQTKNLGLALG